MPLLPTTTPQRTVPIKSFVAYLADGRIVQVLIDGGEGFFREEIFQGSEKSFSTHQCFVANGRLKLLSLFERKGVTLSDTEGTPSDPELPDRDDDNDDEETEDQNA